MGIPCALPTRVYWLALLAYTGEPGMVLKTVSASVVGLPVAPTNGVHLGVDDLTDREPALAALHAERDRDPLDTGDLADQPGQVGDRAAELPGEQAEQCVLLLGGRALVHEHDRLPGLRFEDVPRDVGGNGDRQSVDSDASIVPFSMPHAMVVSHVL